MCGIAGFVIDGVDATAASAALLDALRARGPDGSWSAVRGPLALVETRLAVIDLSNEVVYPMANESGDVHLVFNGEIYDHHLLRNELEGHGHRFRTHCDAEVVLHGYEQWGDDVFPHLNGMFALAIVDERSGDVLLARDRLGIKPLVRTTGRRFAFASDAIALVAAGLSAGEVDLAAIRAFAAFHYVPPPATGIADVVQVAPGTAIRRRRDGTEEPFVWAEAPFAKATHGDGVTLDEAEEALLTAVRRQLVADVGVGVFLSGGLDSTLVLYAAVALGTHPQAFSLGFTGHGDYDESAAAAQVASKLGVPHHVAQFTASFDDAVNAVADAYDAPFADASAIAMIQLAELARAHVTVALSGTGGDELFAGYYRQRAHRVRSLGGRVPAVVRRRRPTPQGRARGSRMRLVGSYLARLADAGGRTDVDQYLALVGHLSSPAGLAALRFSSKPAETATQIAERFGFAEPLSPTQLRAIQRFELRTYLPGDLLYKEDRATMAVGLEGRVPLLDDALLELAERTPENRMMSLRHGKIILRELAERFGAPLTGLKRGFAVPLGAYFEGPWRGDAQEWFISAETDLVERDAAVRLLDEHAPPASDLWMLATLVAWENRLKRARSTAKTTSVLAPTHG
jgi:asparagine synthase (glutamine-hydrolysing)